MDAPGGLKSPERMPRAETPEGGFESAPEPAREQGPRTPTADHRSPPAEGAAPPPVYHAVAPASQVTKDPVLKRVEEILEDGLGDTYFALPEKSRAAFKKKGEDVSARIMKMLAGAHMRAKDVVKLIIEWLRLIPHVNRFFLEQEAKIKTDRIVAFGEQRKDTQV